MNPGQASESFPERFAIFLVRLDPIVGSEIAKTRPCVVISPDELNHTLRTVIIAPLTSSGRPYPWRLTTVFEGVEGRIALDQIRTVDRRRLGRRLGALDPPTTVRLLQSLADLFAP